MKWFAWRSLKRDPCNTVSYRMNSEVAKCADKREQLHTEYGAESFAAWRKEHSGQVLTEHQQVGTNTSILF